MPSPQTIIDQLTLASTSAAAVALGWHVAIGFAVLALVLGWRPSKRAAGAILAMPILSAAAVALAFGNPFNAALLGALAFKHHWEHRTPATDTGGFGLFTSVDGVKR